MKKYLLSLLLVCVGFVSFSSAELLVDHVISNNPYQVGNSRSWRINAGTTATLTPNSGKLRPYTAFCLDGPSTALGVECSYNGIVFTGSSVNRICAFNNSSEDVDFSITCVSTAGSYKNLYYFETPSFNISGGSQYTSEECQLEYDLVPLSDLSSCQGDLSSCNSSLSGCQSNLSGCMTNLDNYSTSLNTCSTNLNVCNTSLSSCMSSNCPVSSGNVSWSSLFINNIQHLGAPIIDIIIPEEFDWDYVSTDEEFTLDIEGYNVDTEYMNGIINIQKTLPNDIDFNNLISFVVPLFIPGLVVILFLYFIFKFIKKIF